MNTRQRQVRTVGNYPFKKKIQVVNAYAYLASYIHGALCQFRQNGPLGFPADVDTYEEWLAMLDEMIWAFNEIKQEYPNSPEGNAIYKASYAHPDYYDYITKEITKDGKTLHTMEFLHPEYHDKAVTPAVMKDEEAYRQRIHQGLMLFAKHFENLWD